MNFESPPINTVAFFICFFIFYFSLCSFADTILDKPRFGKIGRIILFAFAAVFLACVLKMHDGITTNTVFMNIVAYISLAVTYRILYKNQFDNILLLSLTSLVFYMLSKIITISVTALCLGQSVQYVSNTEDLYFWTLLGALLLTSLATVVFLKFMPKRVFHLMNKGIKERLPFTLWFVFTTLFLFVNMFVYTNNDLNFILSIAQLSIAIIVSLACVVVFIFEMKNNDVEYYQEKSKDFRDEADREKFFRNVILVDTVASYECNCTKDTFKLFNNGTPLTIPVGDRYSDMIQFIAKNAVHPDHFEEFINTTMPNNILKSFELGINELICEYRGLWGESSDYVWFRIVINSLIDPRTNEVFACGYLKNIDKLKRQQLELRRMAERDGLTNTYNKLTAEERIKEKLTLRKPGVLFIIDIDNFKSVNDTFGHPFGDNVIVEVASIIQALFRDEDIVGRIGGDEFLVFMPTKSIQQALYKAEMLCNQLNITYEQTVRISASIGMSIFPEHGKSYSDIYAKADIALYTSKNKGKDTFTIYSGESYPEYSNNRTEIESEQSSKNE